MSGIFICAFVNHVPAPKITNWRSVSGHGVSSLNLARSYQPKATAQSNSIIEKDGNKSGTERNVLQSVAADADAIGNYLDASGAAGLIKTQASETRH
jgi:hypothetical protein